VSAIVRRALALMSISVIVGCSAGRARAPASDHGTHGSDAPTFRVSCTPAAQTEFARAVSLLHHMTYPQAREAFRAAAARDPRCAMAHWGVAMTLFQPLWPTRPGPDALQLGWDEVQRAKALAPATERERRFIGAAEAFFLEPAGTDYWLRIRRWEEAMARMRVAFPADDEVAAFAALAHLAIAPADAVSTAHADRAAAILVEVLQRSPEHPGAMHYLVHADDAPGREHEDAQNTRTYERIAPSNPHALHMPTHIYTRLGDWAGVVRGNRLAAEAALRHPAGPNGEFVWDEFPHAIEYLIYGHLQLGEDAEAQEELRRLLTTARLEPTFKTAFHLASTQVRFALERRDWDAATRLVAREPSTLAWDRFPWPEAIVRFGQGYGAARNADVNGARAASARIIALEAAAQRSGEVLFMRNIQQLRLQLDGWIRHLEGRPDEGRALLREAVALELATPKHAVTPGPILPASELLGDLLMEQGRAAEALEAYREALARYPGRRNALRGVERAGR
jgi:tetratricopeptide (TPR) repeat protein